MSISVNEDTLDLGYNDKVHVKVSGGPSNDDELTLKNSGDQGITITSQMKVGGTDFTDISRDVATFTMDSKDSVSVSFAALTRESPGGNLYGNRKL